MRSKKSDKHSRRRSNHRKKTAVQSDLRKNRLRSFFRICCILLVPVMYLSYALSGLFLLEIDVHRFRDQLVWCLTHPIEVRNSKSLPMVVTGILVWGVFTFNYYLKLNYNLMHGQEYGAAKWGDIAMFNEKYAAEDERENKILSENIRFKYDSSTLRNNNIVVVGGSGAGKTSFFLTPNLMNLHGCNIYTDPKGTLVEELGDYLRAQSDTKVYVVDMCEMEKSAHINPFLFIREKADLVKLIGNLIQNTNNPTIKQAAQDPFWEKAERLLLEAIFLYVWLECPKATRDAEGDVIRLEKDWRSVLHLIDEAQFGEGDATPKLDERMEMLAERKPEHPAVKAYRRYRGGPDETVRSVLMTVNARMQPFDNDTLIDIFSSNDIPLDEVGIGKDGDGKTKINIFIVIPDDDDTYNFVPGMIYTLLFQQLYYRARFFGGRLPMDVGFWLDEFANTKMPSNFDKILATCRSRGIYCVPMLQSLAQLKTLFADGAWEGVIGNCDTFLYLGGNEPSTFEYISKLLGKWTIDKKTSGESRGSTGSTSENYDVLGRELMNEYEVRLLPNDECILFVRGEEPLRDKKWYPWEHDEYEKARSFAKSEKDDPDEDDEDDEDGKDEESDDQYRFISDESFEYLKKQSVKNENIRITKVDPYEFMMMDIEELIASSEYAGTYARHDTGTEEEILIDLEKLNRILKEEQESAEKAALQALLENYDTMDLFDVSMSDFISPARKRMIKSMLKNDPKPDEKVILRIIDPRDSEAEMMRKWKVWEEMKG
ncbi:MAG: type IV secretory system conjugative DNA transfer family protein [Eubacterium sp.]|nr:type IV secretory system conjugative DNA transfer family protein [Eubacterium sp.]